MVKITDKTDYSRFVRPNSEDEGIWLDHLEVHLVTHPVGQIKEMHVHDPPQDHVITIRSGRMRWTVEGESLDAGAGEGIVTPAALPLMRFCTLLIGAFAVTFDASICAMSTPSVRFAVLPGVPVTTTASRVRLVGSMLIRMSVAPTLAVTAAIR